MVFKLLTIIAIWQQFVKEIPLISESLKSWEDAPAELWRLVGGIRSFVLLHNKDKK